MQIVVTDPHSWPSPAGRSTPNSTQSRLPHRASGLTRRSARSPGPGAGRPRSARCWPKCLDAALTAARLTDGDVDPTIGAALVALGYDRDFAALETAGPRAVSITDAGDVVDGHASTTGSSRCRMA